MSSRPSGTQQSTPSFRDRTYKDVTRVFTPSQKNPLNHGEMDETIPFIDGRFQKPYGFYNRGVRRTPRCASTTILFQAVIQYRDPEKIKECLAAGAYTNHRDVRGKTLLMYCAGPNAVQIAYLLLRYHANVLFKDDRGNTALFYAVRYENYALAQVLWDEDMSGGLINNRNSEGETPLMVLAKEGYLTNEVEMIRWLLQHGANPNVQAFGQYHLTALELAILSHVQDPPDGVEDTFRRSDECIAKFITRLLDEGRVNANEHNPLLMATRMDLKKTGQVLVDHGADPTREDVDGISALKMAKKLIPFAGNLMYPYLKKWLNDES